MVQVFVSLLGTEKPENILKILEKSGADGVQLDVMDGKYNSNYTMDIFNPESARSFKSISKIPLEVHMMMEEPWKSVTDFCVSCDTIIFHYESCNSNEIKETIKKIKMCDRNVGIAIEPNTHYSNILDYLSEIDLVLVMTVHTGYAGQKFIDRRLEIKELSDYRKKSGLKYLIEIDGGINDKTSRIVRESGADRIVSASFILKSSDKKEAINALRK
jgi:ribulose-phosphate 3-epimerase